MNRRKLIYILLILTCISYGQVSCDDKTSSDNEKKFLKADKKGKADNYDFAHIAFNIAECYRQKNDTICLKWYRRNIASGKSSFKSCDRDKVVECNRTMGQIGISQFYTGQYQESIRYLEKAISYSKNPEYNYFLGLSYMKLGTYDIAIIEFTYFKKATTDIKEVDELIKTCQDKINSK